jgi:hypothetical protein
MNRPHPGSVETGVPESPAGTNRPRPEAVEAGVPGVGLSRPQPEAIEAGVLEGGLWGVKVRWPGGTFVDGMLAETARRLADRVAREGHADLARTLHAAADEADRQNAASEAVHHAMTDDDPGYEER